MSTAGSSADRENRLRGFAESLADWIADWGSVVIDGLSAIGDLAMFCASMLGWLAMRLPRKGTILPNFYQVGVLSLPVVALTGTFIGMVLAVQSYAQFRVLGLDTRLGAVINIFHLRREPHHLRQVPPVPHRQRPHLPEHPHHRRRPRRLLGRVHRHAGV